MLGAGGQGAHGAGHFAGQVVEQDRFADVRAADHRDDQQRFAAELRYQLASQQLVPVAAGRGRNTQMSRQRLKMLQRLFELADLVGPGPKIDSHRI